jgi:glycine/D-amino acid oxidase-like deaminating enzyme
MEPRTADVIVVGAGISGLSIALHLIKSGVQKVTVLERHSVGSGQSGRAAGILRALVNNTAVSTMLLSSLRFFRTFGERYGEALPIHECGYLLIDKLEHEEAMNGSLCRAAAAGCQAMRIDRCQAGELQPGLRRSDDDIYAFEPAAIFLDAMLATQTFRKVVSRLGVEVKEGCEVQSLLFDGTRLKGVETNQGRFLANKVVIATSVLGTQQLKKVGIDVPVFPRRTEMAFFSVFPESTYCSRCILSDARTLLYLRPEGSVQMFVGWREGDRPWSPADSLGLDPENYRQTAHHQSLAVMTQRLTETLPFMADGFVHRTYACVYDYTPDGMPVLDCAESVPGLYFALGFSGGGFSLSPWVGATMARFVVSGRKPPEMELLRLGRFQEGALVSWSNASSSNAAGVRA